MVDPFADVVADPVALDALRAALRRPVHAYLLVGAAGTGTREAAVAFAGALVDTGDGDGARRAALGIHPDVLVVEREGPFITIGAAQDIARLATRSPMEGERRVLVLDEFHLVRETGPALLKSIEEPPPSTVFVILAEHVPPELVTIASRCVRVDFAPLRRDRVISLLVAEGVDADLAAELADVAGGRLDRARLLAADPRFEERRRAWQSVPGRLDGTGATAAAVADELVAHLDASVAPLEARHAAESAALEERNARAAQVNGKVGRGARSQLSSGVKDLADRHKREIRRQRTDELRTGLALLAGTYRERLADAATRDRAVEAVGALDRLGSDLAHNPGEQLALQSLLVRLSRPS